jgi:hypothetical protein
MIGTRKAFLRDAIGMNRRMTILAGSLGLGLWGCAEMAETHISHMLQRQPTPEALQVCHGGSCKTRTIADLDQADWDQVLAQFQPPSPDAELERVRVGQTIGLLERLVAPQAGTASDVGANARAADQNTQLDCVDEAVNTTDYLRLLAANGLLRFHEVELPVHRGGFVDAHNTAVMRDRATGVEYAVESYFYPNGVPAVVLTLADWRAGWDPREPFWDNLTHRLWAMQNAVSTSN